jgi:hypothetical protein
VVVVVGLTFNGTPLVTVVLPGVITPTPLANTAVRFAPTLPPAVIVDGLDAKLVIVGARTTVTVAVCVIAVPAEGVTVRV